MQKTSVIGIDFGTSGCRGVVIDRSGHCLAEAAVSLPPSRYWGGEAEQSPDDWWQGLERLMPELLAGVDRATIGALALDGTSGTVLLSRDDGTATTPALMYNDNRAVSEAERIAAHAPRDCAAHGTGSGLAKALWLLAHTPGPEAQIHTQADWLWGRLCGDFRYSDPNNVLKLGYDPVGRCWPNWLGDLGISQTQLPQVVEPGTPVGTLRPDLAQRWGLGGGIAICAGTTDSTAAFLASGAARPGEAVTSLGSTLVLKVIAERPVFAPEYGVYSQPLGHLWLVGGGSNSGGAVLRQFFTDGEMARLTPSLRPDSPTGLDYYPLPASGERFPLNDPGLEPRLTPRPDDAAQFFQGLLEGIARIEKQGYDKLAALGAPYPTSVRSIGGGARNPAWTTIRQARLGIPLRRAEHEQACYGTALLALKALAGSRR